MSSPEKSEISRREFVKTGSVAAVGVPVAVSLTGRAFGNQGTNEIRCAVVGTGGRGREAHIKSILKVQGARVVANCDPSPKALEAALAMFPGEKPTTYTHHRELLDRESLDAVFIASPPVPHREPIGRIGFVRAQRMSNWYGPGTEEPAMRWLWSVEESGDQLVEQSIHNLDQVNWILDSHPVKCTGLGGQNMVYEPKGRDTSDHFTVVYEYPGRRIVTFTMIKYATPELGGSFTHFYGEKGACDLSGHRFVGRERDARPRIVDVPEDEDATQLAIDDFFRCIREGAQPLCGIEMGKTALLTTLLGRKAFFEERVVAWEDLLREDAPIRRVGDRAAM